SPSSLPPPPPLPSFPTRRSSDLHTGILHRRDCPPARDTTIANASRPFRPLPAPYAVSFRSGRAEQPWVIERYALRQRNRRRHERLIPRWILFPWRWSEKEGGLLNALTKGLQTLRSIPTG